MFTRQKDPIAVKYQTLDLTEWLKEGENVISFITSSSDGVTVDSETISDDKNMITARIIGGALHESDRVSFIWETDQARKDKWSFIFTMEDS